MFRISEDLGRGNPVNPTMSLPVANGEAERRNTILSEAKDLYRNTAAFHYQAVPQGGRD